MMNEWAKHLDKFGSGTIVLMLKYMLLPGSLYGCSNNGEASNCLVTNHNIMKIFSQLGQLIGSLSQKKIKRDGTTQYLRGSPILMNGGITSSRLHQSKIVFHLVIESFSIGINCMCSSASHKSYKYICNQICIIIIVDIVLIGVCFHMMLNNLIPTLSNSS